MDNLHIPENVTEAMSAARRKAFARIEADTRIGELTDEEHGAISFDEIRAAPSAWVECGMAKIVTEADDHNRTGRMSFVDKYPALILRTEAST